MLPNVASVNRIVTIEVNPRWCKFSQRTWKLRREVRERRDWCNIQPLLQFGENSRCIIVFTSHNNRASDDTNITEELRKLTTAIRIDVYLAYRVANFTGCISIETCRLPPRICVVCIRAHRLCNWAVIFCDFGKRGELHIIDYDRECMHVLARRWMRVEDRRRMNLSLLTQWHACLITFFATFQKSLINRHEDNDFISFFTRTFGKRM